MRFGTDERETEPGFGSNIREVIDLSTVGVVLVGVAAGYSLTLLTSDVVALPVVGSVPGVLVGGVGLAVSAIAYRNVACCGACVSRTVGPGGCGCSGECEDSCSCDP